MRFPAERTEHPRVAVRARIWGICAGKFCIFRKILSGRVRSAANIFQTDARIEGSRTIERDRNGGASEERSWKEWKGKPTVPVIVVCLWSDAVCIQYGTCLSTTFNMYVLLRIFFFQQNLFEFADTLNIYVHQLGNLRVLNTIPEMV